MYALTVTGFCVWVAYGVMKWDWAIMLTNTVCGCFAAFILFMRILPQRKKEAVAETLDPNAD